MTSRTARNEGANAEILGVVILIGIFAITAGIISATTLATPEAQKVPAASIEITGSSGAIRIAHLGGDPLPADSIVRGTKSDGTTETFTLDNWLGLSGDPLANGFSKVTNNPWVAAVVVWTGSGGETSVIAIWDPNGIYGPLGPSVPSGGSVPGVQTPRPTQPVWPTPNTTWNATAHNLTANFTPERTVAAVLAPVQFIDTSTGNVTVTNWSWNFGDGMTSNLKNPTHAYGAYGNYTVTLTVSNQSTGASSTAVKEGCVKVTGTPSPVDFDVSPTLGSRILTVTCTDRSGSAPTLWRWTATDGLNPSNVTTVGPVGSNLTYNPRVQTFTFYNPTGLVNDTCRIRLQIWSPYFESPVEITKEVTVAPPLTASFRTNLTNWTGVAPSTGCPVSFQDTSTGAPQTWEWSFGDGTPNSTEQNPVHTYFVGPNEVRTFKVNLTVTGWGQTSIYSHDVTIYPSVVAKINANVTAGLSPLTVQFVDQSTGFPTKWLWDFGDNTTSTEQNPVHTFVGNGTYDVTLFAERGTDPHSADQRTFPIYIRVGFDVFADFEVNRTTGFAPFAVKFTDLSTSADPIGDPIGGWRWDFDSNGVTDSTEINPVHTYNTAGTYAVTLTVNNTNRVNTTTKVGLVTVYEEIHASFTANQTKGLKPLTIQFTDTSTGFPTSWFWDFGDNTNSTLRDPVHTFAKNGTYSVTLTASHSQDSDTSTSVDYVVVSPDPCEAMFDANLTAGPANLTVQFTDTSGGPPTDWEWSFGDGSPNSTEPNPVHVFDTIGIHSVNLTTWSAGCGERASIPVNITVYRPIKAAMSVFNPDGKAPLAVSFFDNSTGDYDRWNWSFGDGTYSNLTNPVHLYTALGPHTANLTVWNSLRPDLTYTASTKIVVYGTVEASFTANGDKVPDPLIELGPLMVQFTDTSTGYPIWWTWDFDNDGTIDSTQPNPTHEFTSGNYTVTLRVGNPDGEASLPATRTIVVYGTPVAAIGANVTAGLAPLTVQFTDRSTGNPFEWLWEFGDGDSSTERNPVHTFETADNYTVTLYVKNPAGESDSVPQNIGAFDLPKANFNANVTSGDAPLTVQFTDATTGDGITGRLWTFGDGGTSTLQNPIYTYAVPGTYTVNLTVTNPAGSDFIKDSITVTEPVPIQDGPTSAFSANVTSGSAPLAVQFSDASTGTGITGWTWAFGDGTTSSDQNPVHTYAAGTYNVSLTVTNATGSGYHSQIGYITVTAAPMAAFSANVTSGPAPVTVQFTDESTGNPTYWAWDFNDNGIIDTYDRNPVCIYPFVGTYDVRLTVTNANGSDSEVKVGYITVT